MAGDWIKWRKGLARDPATLHIASKLKIGRHEAAARLMEVWEWADEATVNGVVPCATATFIDEVAGKKGFAAAMASTPDAPWLSIDVTGITFPHFDRHNGKAAKARAQSMNRMRELRGGDDDPGDSESGVTPSLRSARNESDTREREREEKRKDLDHPTDDLAGAPPRAKLPRKAATGPHAELIAWWKAEYLETQQSPYVGSWAAVGASLKELLREFSPEEIRTRAARWLRTDHGWIANSDRNFSFFAKKFNEPVCRGITPRARPVNPPGLGYAPAPPASAFPVGGPMEFPTGR